MRHRFWIWSAAMVAAQVVAAEPQGSLPRWPALESGGAYVFFMSKDVTLVNGTPGDLARAGTRRSGPAEELFWFERGGKEYVVRGAPALFQLKAVFAPQIALGQQQSALAARRGQLGREQTVLEAQLSELQGQQAAAGERMNGLFQEQAVLQEDGADTSAVEAEMQGMQQEQAIFEQRQREIGDRRDELFRQQQALARQLAELDQKQEQATAQAERQLRSLVGKALADGTAKALK
jgi:hypothetical protein